MNSTLKSKKSKLSYIKYIIIPIVFIIIVIICIKSFDNFYKPLDTTNVKIQKSDNYDNWNIILVNKWNKIPDNYRCELVSVPGGEKVDQRIYKPLMNMLEDAKTSNWGKEPIIVSGYRTASKQKELYEEKINEYKKKGYSNELAVKEAEKWVAKPGYSEHELGFAVDINGATYDLYLWLENNSYKYGFIFRYQAHKTAITGVAKEVWHYRYVGVDVATQMYEKGMCLEEYIESLNQKN